MAAIVRYFAEFKDRKGKEWRVEFCDKEFSGSESEITLGADAFTLNWAGDANTPHQPIVTSSAQFFLIVESTGVYDWLLELPNAAADRFTVAIKYGTGGGYYTLRWAGVLMVDGVEIEDIYLPQKDTLQANDDLARLQDVLYKSSEAVEYTGTAYIHEHIRNCILKLRTAHHWEDSDTLLRMVPYLRPSNDTDDGFQLTQIKHDFLHNSNEEGEKQYLSTWRVLEEIAYLYGARIFLDFGGFWFQPISAFTRDTAQEKLLGVEFYTKGGTIYTGIDVTSYNDFDTDIERIRGWSSSFLPRIKRVEREYNSGDTLYLGYQTQWPYASNFGDNGDELVENLTDAPNPVYLGTPLGGYCFVQQNMLPRFRFLFVCKSNAITGLTGNNKAVRWRFELYMKLDAYGASDYYLNRNLSHDTTNITPLLLTDGSIVEVSGVDYSAPTWGTNAANRATFISTPVDGTQAHTISEYLEINLPEINHEATVLIAVAAHAIDADGNDLTTAHSFVIAQYAQANTLYPAHGEVIGADKYLYYAEAEGGREVIKLPPAIVGDKTSESTHNYTEFSGAPTTLWEKIDETATEPVHQHVVREILSYRAKAMLIRSGLCRPIHTNNSAGILPFGYSLTEGTDIYICLAMDWHGARAEYDIQIGLLDRDTNVINSEDGDIPVVGAPPPTDGGPVVIPSTPATRSTEAQETNNNILATVLRQSMRKEERTKLNYITSTAAIDLDTVLIVLNRIVGDYTADAGAVTAIAPIGIVTTPAVEIYKKNANSVTQSTTKIQLTVGQALSSSYALQLPQSLPATGDEVVLLGSNGKLTPLTDGSSGEVLTTNGAGALSWAAGGGGSSDGWHGSATLLKVMPTEFIMNDDYSRAPTMVEDDTTNTLGIRAPSSVNELYAFVAIPTGYKATHVQVYASVSTALAVNYGSFDHTTGAIVSKNTFDFNTNTDVYDLTSSATIGCYIKLLPASSSTMIYGADVTIVAV